MQSKDQREMACNGEFKFELLYYLVIRLIQYFDDIKDVSGSF